MSFISPMLAAAMPKNLELKPGIYAAEEKFDGHRLVVQRGDLGVTAWSRTGLQRKLPSHLLAALSVLPSGIYDGELIVPGQRSYGVKEIGNENDLEYRLFDILELSGHSTLDVPQGLRREYLEEISASVLSEECKVVLAASTEVNTFDELSALLHTIWSRDGEGVILKRLSSRYLPGKRPKDVWIKMKALRSGALEIIGFCASQGEIVNRGLYGITILRDREGNIVPVKTRNDEELARLQREESVHGPGLTQPIKALGKTYQMHSDHPRVGTLLRIEYQERTPDGGYRHPRWDRYESE